MKKDTNIAAVLAFWFDTISSAQWFEADAAVDAACRERFLFLYEQLASRVPAAWIGTPGGCVAAVIVLDQFPRNMFRSHPRAFASDDAAMAIAEHAIENGFDAHLEPRQRMFLYMPFQHREDQAAQARSVALFAKLGIEEALDSAKRHKLIVDRFGRFPHRNDILGRPSSDKEKAFLAMPGSSF